MTAATERGGQGIVGSRSVMGHGPRPVPPVPGEATVTVKLEDLISTLGLEVERGRGGKWVIPAHLVETLREVDRLAQEGAGPATMRRVLGITMVPEPPAPVAFIVEEAEEGDDAPAPTAATAPAVEAEPVATTEPDADGLPTLVAAAVTGALKTENELGEKYARAAHRIGELEATARALEAERDRLAGELAGVRAEATAAQAQLADLRTELVAARHERDHLRALRTAPPPRPWWKFWA